MQARSRKRLGSRQLRGTLLVLLGSSAATISVSGCASQGSGFSSWNPFAKSPEAVAAAPAPTESSPGITSRLSSFAQGTKAQAGSVGMAAKSAYGKTVGAVTGLFGSKDTTETDNGEKVADNDPLLLKNTPTSIGPEVFVANGQLWETSGNFDRAMDNYTKALEKEPNNSPALASIARLNFRQQRYEQSVEYFQRAIKSTPAEAALYNDLGLAYSKLGRHEEAVQTMDKALAIAPGTSKYANNLATVQYEAGREEEARATLLRYNKPAVAHYNLAYLHFSAQRNDKALQELTQVLSTPATADTDPASQRAIAKSREMYDKLGGPATQIAQALPQVYNAVNQSAQAVAQVSSGARAQIGDVSTAIPQQNIQLSGQQVVAPASTTPAPSVPAPSPAPAPTPANTAAPTGTTPMAGSFALPPGM
jgi:hypothetical protein